MKTTRQVLTLVTLLSATLSLCGQVPSIVTYQGRLQAGGTNFNGAGQFKFAIVNQGTNAVRQATATATVSYGFIVAVNVVAGGAGYTTAPAVTITDPTGSNAVVTANVLGGAVVSFNILNNGRDYSSSLTVIVAPPPPNMAYLTYWSHDGTSVNGSEPATSVPVPVSQGLFAVGLGDTTLSNMSTLPDSVFANANPSLRIWFSDGVGSVQQLSPDQPFTSAACALMAVTASNVSGTIPSTGLSGTYGRSVLLTNASNSISGDGSGLTGLNASALASGTVPGARLSGTYSGPVNFSSSGNSFSGDGSGLTGLNASALASGTVPGARLSGIYGSAVSFSSSANSFTGTGAGLFNLDAGALASGTVPSQRLAGSYSNTVYFTSGVNTFSGSFSGSGSGLTGLNAGSLSSGTVPDARLSANVALLSGGAAFAGPVSASSFSGSGASLTGLDAGNLATGTVPGGRLSGSYNNALAFASANNSFAGTFSGNGAGLTNLNASNVASGTLPDARLSVNVALLSGPANFSGPVSATSFSGSGASLTSLNAGNLSSGTVSDSRLSANVDLLNLPGTFTMMKTFNIAPSFAAAVGAPFTVSSSTLVGNLNADMLDGVHASALATNGHTHAATDISSGTLPVNRGGTGAGTVGSAGAVVFSTGSAYGFSPQGMLNQILKSGGSTAPAWGAVNLNSPTEVTGMLSSVNGGTGFSVFSTGDLLYASGSSMLNRLGIGTAGEVLTVVGGLPDWQSANSHNHLGQTWSGSGTVGLQVETTSSSGNGLYGRATSTSGTGCGVYGDSAADNGIGVCGVATSTGSSAVHIGVMAAAASGDKNLALYANTYDTSRPTYSDLPRAAAIAARVNSGDDIIQGYATGYNLRFRVSDSGTIYAVNTTVQSVDLAECVPVSEAVEAGDVVEVDPTLKETFRRCREQCSPRVAGVISTRPGLLLGYDDPACNSDAKPPMALAGRVPVKVTLEAGPIRPGDLLTSSSTPGHAMKAVEPWRGGLIGTALESFGDNDPRDRTAKGTIVMLVHLRPAPASDQALFTRMQGEAVAQKEQLAKLQEILAAQQQVMRQSEARFALLERALGLKKEKPGISDLAVSIGQTQEP